jgi:TatD DNase family protein
MNGVVHCFSGSIDDAKKILDMGFYISFTANITYPKAGGLRDVVSYVPVERIMVETDAPFLAPQIIRGKRNQPCHCVDIGEAIACIKGLSRYDVERITTLNAIHLFGIGEIRLKGSIAYPIRNSLYLNITNRCTNSCSFCIRNKTTFVKGHFLKLEKEPDFEEIISAIGDPMKYREVVFCGFGEPTIRLDIVLRVADWLKRKGIEVRLNTNGHANLIAGKDVVPDMVGKIDRVSISLDAHNADVYNRICAPVFGEHTFEGVLQFAKRCRDLGLIVELTVVRFHSVDIQKCRKIAEQIGADFRVREYDEVG